MSYPCQRYFHLNDWHRANAERAAKDFVPKHDMMALVACCAEELGEISSAVLGVTGEKARKKHLTKEDILDGVADCMTYLSLLATEAECTDLERLLGTVFNMVSDRAGSKIKVGV